MVQFYIVCMLYTVECFYHTELTCLVCVAFLSCLCSTVIVADVLLDSYSCKGDVMCLTAIFHLIFFACFTTACMMYMTVTVVFVQSDVAINTFCQDQLPVIIGFVLLNTNVPMRIFFCDFFGYIVHNFLTLKYAKNMSAAGAPPRTPLGELTMLPQTT